MQVVALIPTDVPSAFLMAALFLVLGIVAIQRLHKLVATVENLALVTQEFRIRLTGEPRICHANRIPLPLVRFTFGTVGIGGAVLCAYIAYLSLSR